MSQGYKMKKMTYLSICLFFLFISLIVLVKFIFFSQKLPTQSVNIANIKSVQIINLDRSKNRRDNYEKMLKNNIGDKFLGFNIGDEIRLSGIDGKKDVVFENIDNGEKITYNENRRNNTILMDGIYKVYSKNDKSLYVYYTNLQKTVFKDNSLLFNKFGCNLSHLLALRNISKLKNDEYGLILEDDFLVGKDFYRKLQNVLNNAPTDFDVLKISLQHRKAMQGYKRIAIRPNTLQVVLHSFGKFGYGDWIDNSVMDTKVKQFVNGAQAYIVSKKGAEKILQYYASNIAKHENDVLVFYTIPKENRNIKVYTYLKQMPVLLRYDAQESFIDLD